MLWVIVVARGANLIPSCSTYLYQPLTLKNQVLGRKALEIKIIFDFFFLLQAMARVKKRRENGGRYRWRRKKYIFAFFSFFFLFSAFDASPVIFATEEEEEEEARSANDTSDREGEEDQTGEAEEEDKTEKWYFHARMIWRVQCNQRKVPDIISILRQKCFPQKKQLQKGNITGMLGHLPLVFNAFF